jgi:hypothetical protein
MIAATMQAPSSPTKAPPTVLVSGSGIQAEVVPRFVDLEVAVPHLSPAVW